MKRETGYYWIKYANEWRVAYWQNLLVGFPLQYWTLPGSIHCWNDEEFQKIKEERIKKPL